MTHAIIPSISIAAFVERRNVAAENIRQAHAKLLEANKIMRASCTDETDVYSTPKIVLKDVSDRDYFTDDDGAETAIRKVDAKRWDYLLKQSGLITFMDAEARQQWATNIARAEVPELTPENIAATFANLYNDRQQMFERGVVKLFRALSWDYKTNTPIKFGKRIVLSRIVDTWGGKQKWSWCRLGYDSGNRLDDLVRVLYVLDGRPEPDHRESAANVLREARWPGEGVNPFRVLDLFEIKGFKNGNAHVTFLRADLVDHMNAIIAKHHPNALPPAREPA